jgi:hypothetical protein
VQGIYVLQDNNFRWLQRLAPVAGGAASSEDAVKKTMQSYLYLPCGIIRGGHLTRHLPIAAAAVCTTCVLQCDRS